MTVLLKPVFFPSVASREFGGCCSGAINHCFGVDSPCDSVDEEWSQGRWFSTANPRGM